MHQSVNPPLGNQPIEPTAITGVVLAGGRGSRMNGEDKGLMQINGRPMVEHVITRLRPQVGALLISATRNLEQYERFGYPVVPDILPDYQGPLAGIASALQVITTPYIVAVPCDSPFIADDLVARLAQAMAREQTEIAIAHDGERKQPAFLLMKCSLSPSLCKFLDDGERKMERWLEQHDTVYADFRDCPQAFVNINDTAALEALATRLRT